MANPNSSRDENFVPTLSAVSSVDQETIVPLWADPTTHRLLVDLPSSSGTVTSVSVVAANGFSGTVATQTTTPAITLSTTVSGVLKGSGAAIVAAVNSDLPVMTATVGGAVPTPPNNTTTFLRGDGTFASPAGSGTVTSVTFVSANGFTGTTGANPTTTPAITVGTALVTPVLAGNGSAMIAGTVTGTGSTVVLQDSPTLTTPNLGTPSALVGTNITGTALGLTVGTSGYATNSGNASTVTTNANLTGPITSTGNATAIASQTGTGTTFVVQTSPTLITPTLGVATATSINGLGIATTTGTLAVATGTIAYLIGGTSATLTATQTLTNKRITRRVVSVGTSATPTINTDNGDIFEIVNQNVAITSMSTNLSGSPLEGDLMEIKIKDAGAAVAITWGAHFGTSAAITTLPTTTGTSAVLRTLFQYETSAVWSGSSAWIIIAQA